MNRLTSDVQAFLLKLNHGLTDNGEVPRLISNYESVSFQLDYAKPEDVVFKNRWGKPILVVDPCLAQHLEERPLVVERQGGGYFLTFKDRRTSERMALAVA